MAAESRPDLAGTVYLGEGTAALQLKDCVRKWSSQASVRVLVFSSPMFSPVGNEARGHSDSYPASAPTELLLLSALTKYISEARRQLAILKYSFKLD